MSINSAYVPGNKTTSKPRHGWIVALFGSAIGGVVFLAGWKLEGAALAVLAFAPLYLNIDRKLTPELMFGPGLMVYLYHGLGYALGPLGQRYLIGQERFIESGFVSAQWGCVIGLTIFALVFPPTVSYLQDYQSKKMKGRMLHNDNKLPDKPADDQWKQFSLLLLALTFVIVVVGFTTGAHRRLGGASEVGLSLQSVVALWIQVRILIWFFLGYAAAKFRGGWIMLWFISYLVYSGYVFLDGSRGWVLYAMLFSVNGAVMAGVSRKRLLLLLSGFIILFAPFTTIVSDYRTNYGEVASSFSDRAYYFETAAVEYLDNYDSGATGLLNTILDHSTAQNVDLIFFLTPTVIPHAGLTQWERIFFIVIPRVVSPDRPSPITSGEIACQYRSAMGIISINNPRCGLGSYTTTVGDGYRRLGWFGIAMLYGFQALLFAILFGLSWRYKGKIDRLAFAVWLMWAMAGAWAMPFIDFFYFLGWTAVKYFLLFWLIGKLLDSHRLRNTPRRYLSLSQPQKGVNNGKQLRQ